MSATAIFEFQNFDFLTFRRFESIIVRHGAKFRDDRSNYCLDMATFRFFKMAAPPSFGFLNFKFLMVGQLKRVELHHCAKFCGKPLLRYGDFLTFARWRPSAILDF